jgi:hemerythrin superfamily protein
MKEQYVLIGVWRCHMPSRIEEVASKGMGAAKKVKATVEGMHGVFRRLAEEHGEVTALLMRVKASSDPEVRRELFPVIRAELLGHEKGELKNVYPEFEQYAELAPIAKDHNEESTTLERLLEELHAMSYEDNAWASKFGDLVELVSHHIEEEEENYFPAGERVLGEKRAEEMLSRYEETKSAVTEATRSEPH